MGPITQNKKFKKPRCYVRRGAAIKCNRTRNRNFQMYDSACGTPWFCSIQLFQQTLSESIRHLQISHNAPYLPPQILHNLRFSFLLVLQPSQGKLKLMLMQNFGGQIRCIMGDKISDKNAEHYG